MSLAVTSLKGIGEKKAEIFSKLGIYTIEDLIKYFPRNYETFKEPVTLKEIFEDQIVDEEIGIKWKIRKEARNEKAGKNQITVLNLEDSFGQIKLKWFHMPFLKKTLQINKEFVFWGKIQKKGGVYTIEQPKIYTVEDYEAQLGKLQPVYPLTKGISNKEVKKAVTLALEKGAGLEEWLPDEIIERNNLISYESAIRILHFPNSMETLQGAYKRVVFEEFFLFLIMIKELKKVEQKEQNNFYIKMCTYTDKILRNLPYELTGAQTKVWKEVYEDLKSDYLMSRLIQGDVGSGKTILAFLSLITMAENGYQSVLMVPTEVLARQHFENLIDLLEKNQLTINCRLLTGSCTAKEKRVIYQEIEEHKVDIVIGTHAIIQEPVKFHDLGLVITDEQHRFGVRQRESLANKGISPHILVMSATPIPRTLAIILYGDLSLSVIDELPAQRLPIKNCVVTKQQKPSIYKFIKEQIDLGHQCYVICPMVSENEELDIENVEEYSMQMREWFEGSVSVAMLHGKMKNSEKIKIMGEFEEGIYQILVSTTVIEVGIDVKNATVIVIENAERFGLAQLHQLRGRVGRSNLQSYCILVSGSKKKETMERLEILNRSNDGFYIANEDLKLRGPGDFFGIRQSGAMEFKLADIYRDAEILKQAYKEVEEFYSLGYQSISSQDSSFARIIEKYKQIEMSKINL